MCLIRGEAVVQSNRDIYEAIETGNLEFLIQSVKDGFDLLELSYRGQPIIVHAIECGHREIVGFILTLGLSPTETIKSGYDNITLLHLACKLGKTDVVELLLPLTDLKACKGEHYDGKHIHVASAAGHSTIVKLLLEAGVDIDLRGGVNEETALHCAVGSGQKSVVEFLIKKGANVNAKNRRQNTALHFAAASGHLDIGEFLLGNGASVTPQTDYGATPLHLVAGPRSAEFAKLLIENGAYIEAQEVSRATPLINGVMKGDAELVKCLLELGANFDAQRNNDKSALNIACKLGNEEMVSLLLKAGAKVRSDEIFLAIEQKSVTIVKTLVGQNISLCLRDERGWQPLHRAVALGYGAIVRLILSANAPVDGLTDCGLTPRDIARMSKMISMDMLLEELGGTTKVGLPNTKSKIISKGLDLMTYNSALALPPALTKYREKLSSTVKPYLRLHANSGEALYPWESKFGGIPYLPRGIEYPRAPNGEPLYFLAQINFAESPSLAGFPSKGILTFYITEDYIMCESKEKERQDYFRVQWFEDVVENPSELTLDFDFLPLQGNGPIPKPYGIEFEIDFAPMSWEDARFKSTFGKSLYQIWEASFEDKEKLFKTRQHKVGGYAAFMQDDPRYYFDEQMAEYYESNRKDDYIEDDDAPGGRRYIGPKHDTLLLQLASYDGTEICWGDCGTAAFFISSEDLNNRNFSRVFFDWACA